MITSEELEAKLWAGADELRGYMDASRYKDYMLGVMFYKFLSEETLEGYRRATRLQGTERTIRQKLIEKNFNDTIIGLPANLFTNTGIPVMHSARANPENILNVEELIIERLRKGSILSGRIYQHLVSMARQNQDFVFGIG